jgi:Flp pilus assembly protein CpaB
MSLKQVVIAMQGYNNHFEQQEQTQWERIRWQTTLLLNVHTAKGKSLKPKDLIEFPWETDNVKPTKRSLSEVDKSIFEKWDKE